MSRARADSRPQAPSDLIELGRIVSAYGIRGWVKVQPHSAQAEVLLAASSWWLQPRTEREPAGQDALRYPVLVSRPQGATVVASLSGVSDRETAHALRGLGVYVSRSDFPPPEEGEYYWVDLIGCMLFGDRDGQPAPIGRVAEVIDNGAHAVLRVHRLADGDADAAPALDAKGRPVEVLVPFVAAHVRGVELAARRIDTDWPVDF